MNSIKTFTFLIIISFTNVSFSQINKKEIDDKLNSLFLNIDTTIKPEKIESEYRTPIDYDSKKIEPEKNIITFKKHPNISSFYVGNLNTTYLFDEEYFKEFGLYKIKMNLYFKDSTECMNEYTKIIDTFENFGTTKIETITKSEFDLLKVESINTLFLKNEFEEFPRLEIYYAFEETENINIITITLMKSWNNKNTDGVKFFEN